MSSPPEESDEWKAQDKGPTIIVVCWIVTAISTCFVLGRVYVRGKIMRKFHSDDWFIILGLVSVSFIVNPFIQRPPFAY